MSDAPLDREERLHDRVEACAEALRMLAPSHRSPESFHADKSELEHKLRGIADELRRETVFPSSGPAAARRPRRERSVIFDGRGRQVIVEQRRSA